MWEQSPRANIGVNCGLSGLLVVDLDGDAGRDNWADIAARHGGHETTLVVDTGGGGLHIYFNGAGPSTVGRIAPGVDTRGSGGYVIAPPSLHANGRRYRFANNPAAPIADAPEWLLELLAPPPRRPADHIPTQRIRLPSHAESTPYGHRALEGLCAQVANAPEGSRNHELFNRTLRATRLALAGESNLNYATEMLLDAALTAGLKPDEAHRTIKSAIAIGRKEGPAHPPPRRG